MPEWFHLRRFFRHFDVDCVFDVGANRGQYARMLRDKANFRGEIISFEPIPELVKELQKISASDPRWHIAGIALDREAGPATFHVMADLEFSSFLRPSAAQPAIFKDKNRILQSITVNRSTLAAQFTEYQKQLGFKRPFLKMDTQGSDLAVVEGAGSAMDFFIGIQTELSLRQLYDAGPELVSSMKKLSELGFEPSAFVPNNEGHFPALVEIDCIFFRRGQPAPRQLGVRRE
jgi:FkbM family methyltransferase